MSSTLDSWTASRTKKKQKQRHGSPERIPRNHQGAAMQRVKYKTYSNSIYIVQKEQKKRGAINEPARKNDKQDKHKQQQCEGAEAYQPKESVLCMTTAAHISTTSRVIWMAILFTTNTLQESIKRKSSPVKTAKTSPSSRPSPRRCSMLPTPPLSSTSGAGGQAARRWGGPTCCDSS